MSIQPSSLTEGLRPVDRVQLGISLCEATTRLVDISKFEDALDLSSKAVKVFEAIEESNIENFRSFFVTTLGNRSISQFHLGRFIEAEESVRRAIEQLELLSKFDPDEVSRFLVQFVIVYGEICNSQSKEMDENFLERIRALENMRNLQVD